MRILFLAPAYAGLHILIIEEMKRQGHDVAWINDTAIWYQPESHLNSHHGKENNIHKQEPSANILE